MEILLVVFVLFLAFSNGSNDNFKGVATLYGTGLVKLQTAIFWSTIFTLMGVILSIVFAENMVKLFSGKGLVSDDLTQSIPFILSVVISTGITVLLATRLGMPISTTHGLIGGLVGAGLANDYSGVELSFLLKTFLWPLLLSPVVAALLGLQLRKLSSLSPTFELKNRWLHWFSGIAICAMRGMNDAPKLAGMLLLVPFLGLKMSLLLIGVAMCIGGWLNSKKIAETLGQKLAKMDEADGTMASFSTFLMVGSANLLALPVSTTHVNVGSIYGVSLFSKNGQLKTLFGILKSWLLTLPVAAILAFIIYKMIQFLDL